MIEGSAELFCGQCVQDAVGSATEPAEPRDCRQEERKTLLHGFYFKHVFRGSEMAKCVILTEMNFTSSEALSQRALEN